MNFVLNVNFIEKVNFFIFQYLPGKSEAIFSRSSSTSGTDSSIRIRKAREGCTERRWFISVSLALIFTVLVASAGIYFGCKMNFLKLDFGKLKKESVIIFAADFYFVELIFPLHKSIYFFASSFEKDVFKFSCKIN